MLPARLGIYLTIVALSLMGALSASRLPGNSQKGEPCPQASPSVEAHPLFVPTPIGVAREMLQLAGVGTDDVVYDLGSGDGRIVIMAASEFGAYAVGVEIDQKLARQSQRRIAELGLEERARIIRGDLFAADLVPATVVTLYLSSLINRKLRPVLEKELQHGARVVAETCEVPGWQPQKVVHVKSEGGIPKTIYLYVRP